VSGSFLEDVVARVRESVASADYGEGVPAVALPRPPSFKAAVERERHAGALVVEYKRASPGATVPLPPSRTIEAFVAATDVEGVAGYSCLATRHGFDGAPERVAELVARTRRPVLFKEFVVGTAQLDVARRTGASAVLLIARLEPAGLLDRPLRELASEARARGLEVVLELHDSAELSRVDGVAPDVTGVNVRDLASLALDRPTAFATIEAARRAGLAPLLGLSGVDGPPAANEFWSRGCDGLLVGSAVARSDDPKRLLASLRRPPGPGAEGR
jgi:indole-3-glycerol phosphate synthase